MRDIYWGVATLFLWLICIGCMVNNYWMTSLVFFGLGLITLHGAEPRRYR